MPVGANNYSPLRCAYRLFFREIGFVHAANRAGPVGGKIFKGGAGGDAVVGITDLGIVRVTAHVANVFIHVLRI